MSFLAKFEMDGQTMNVLEFQCTIDQEIDKRGQPSSDPNGGQVRVILESTKSNLIIDWMLSNAVSKNGKITFFRRDAISKMREFEFNDGHCIRYDELFTSEGTIPMKVEILISAKEFIMNGSKLTRNWSGGSM
jgi:Hemolysin coregulated protein Hcp (TssD)